MNLLRAQVRTTDGWWELALLDLDIVADGGSEDEMLRDVEHALISEYHLALRAGETPFVKLFRGCPAEVSRAWESNDKALRFLKLPPEVKMALAAVFHAPSLCEFKVEPVVDAA